MAFSGFGPQSYLGRFWQIVKAETIRLRNVRYVSSEWRDGHFISTEDPIIIGGCGRSGTTLMSVMLNSHSQVYCGREDSLLLGHDFSLTCIANDYGYDVVSLIKQARRFANRGQFTEFLMRDQKQRRNVSRFATKQPHYALNLPSLFHSFPCARFVYLCRDGRDVAVSLRKNERHMGQRYDRTHDATGMLSMTHCAEVWRLYVNAFYPFENDRRCKLVRYEDLSTHPREVLVELCEFLGLPFEESMLSFHSGKGAEGRDDLSMPHLAKTKSPVDSSRIGVWKHELTVELVREFEKHAGRELLHAGYELNEPMSTSCRAPSGDGQSVTRLQLVDMIDAISTS